MKLAEARRRKLLRCSEQQNHRCCYCGRHTWHPSYGETGRKNLAATLEHVHTRREGGTDSMNNLVMACSGCNNGRGDHFGAVEFYEMVVGLRPRLAPTRKEENKELRAQREAKRAARGDRMVVDAAALLCALELWWWWDCWLEYGVQYELP